MKQKLSEKSLKALQQALHVQLVSLFLGRRPSVTACNAKHLLVRRLAGLLA